MSTMKPPIKTSFGTHRKEIFRSFISKLRPMKLDALVKAPSAALGDILTYCGIRLSTPHSSEFARLAPGAFPRPSPFLSFYDSVKLDKGDNKADHGPPYWNKTTGYIEQKGYYLDSFLGNLKRRTYLGLIHRWGGVPATGRILKTDLFEEAMKLDAFLADLSDRGKTVVGIDVSETTVTKASLQDTDKKSCYVVADVRRLPFADNTFRSIISPSTLDHFSDHADLGKSLRECARVLEPGGGIIITLDNRQNILDPLLRLLIRLGFAPYFIGRSYTVRELRDELHDAGFTVLDTTAILHNPRLLAVGAVYLFGRLGSETLNKLVRRIITAAQKLERSSWRYYTGSFIAAKAVLSASAGEQKERSNLYYK